MPCLDRFAEQDRGYRDELLPPAVKRAGRRRGGEPDRLAPLGGRPGDVVAMESFGASAPAKVVYEHFGITGEKSPTAPGKDAKPGRDAKPERNTDA